MCINLTKNESKTSYEVIDGRLCIKHYLLLQQLVYRKKLKDNTYKEYYSYHIKLPRVIYELINPVDDTVYLEYDENRIIVHKESNDSFKRLRIQRSVHDSSVIYQLTIPQKFLKLVYYESGKTAVVCQVIATDNDEGYEVTLELQGVNE